jgi:hypothetical protein
MCKRMMFKTMVEVGLHELWPLSSPPCWKGRLACRGDGWQGMLTAAGRTVGGHGVCLDEVVRV